MQISGGCHCGAVTYEAQLDPEKVGICHCTDCQVTSASDYRTIAMVDAKTFRLTGAEPKTYIKTADSGNQRILAFCGTCGTGIYSAATDDPPALYNLRAGTINQRRDLPPRYEIWCTSALPWVNPVAGAKRYCGQFV